MKQLDKVLPVYFPSYQELVSFFKSTNQLASIWIGQSTVLLNINGFIILVDPMFSKRASPIQLFGPARYRPVPFKIDHIQRLDVFCLCICIFNYYILMLIVNMKIYFVK